MTKSQPHTLPALSAALVLIALTLAVWALVRVDASALTSGHVDVRFVSVSTDDPPGTVDPGYDKDVADCSAEAVFGDLILVTLTNGYPSYTCTFTVAIQNVGFLPVKLNPLDFDVPPALTITDLSNNAGILLLSGETDVETFSVHVEQEAEQSSWYTFVIHKTFMEHATGTIGFWRNWDSHNTFTQPEIETWLSQIDSASLWYGPTTTEGMVELMQSALGKGASRSDKFLAHCLATRLNVQSGIFDASDTHDVSSADKKDYLALTDPTNATLASIIAAIESKFGTSPTSQQFQAMKNVCDGLNNLDF